ncbi:MAG: aspartate/glutamate racemase family protein [Promethearchaeati archaeon SRVP18_Atabeyarchaeia-1]
MLSRGSIGIPRLGIIIPSSNTTMEAEFNWIGKDRFSTHATRLRLRRVTVGELEKMEKGFGEAAALLADAAVEIIAYGCTSGSLFRGLGHDVEIANQIHEKTGLPSVVTSGCVVKALKAMGTSRVCVATPYTAEVNNLEKKFLEDNGFEVSNIKGLGLEENLDIGNIQRQNIVELVRKVNDEKAQSIFVSCTNLPTISMINYLEQAMKKPVISSNTATLWSMFRTLDLDSSWINGGRIFRISRR